MEIATSAAAIFTRRRAAYKGNRFMDANEMNGRKLELIINAAVAEVCNVEVRESNLKHNYELVRARFSVISRRGCCCGTVSFSTFILQSLIGYNRKFAYGNLSSYYN